MVGIGLRATVSTVIARARTGKRPPTHLHVAFMLKLVVNASAVRRGLAPVALQPLAASGPALPPQALRDAGRNDSAPVSSEQFANASNIGCDNRFLHRHRLANYQRHPFPRRGKSKRIGGIQQGRHIAPQTEPSNVFHRAVLPRKGEVTHRLCKPSSIASPAIQSCACGIERRTRFKRLQQIRKVLGRHDTPGSKPNEIVSGIELASCR